MRLYFCRTMLRHNLAFSATVSAVSALMGSVGRDFDPLVVLAAFAKNLQICLVSVGLGFCGLVFHSFMRHTLPLYWNLGISPRQLVLLAAVTGLTADLLLSAGLLLGGFHG